MKRVIITFLCLLCIVQAYSQSFTISGTIIDGESNEPLIGAGILVKGAGRGTITNIDGKYSLEVKRGETLVFSFVGYQNQEVAITNQRTLNIALRVSEANNPVSYTHLRAHETDSYLVCRLLLEKKKK